MKLIKYAFALALLASPVAAQDVIEGKALALDGDTILVTLNDGKAVKVRLGGIDAPEMKAWPWGPQARGVLDEILRTEGPYVRCRPEGKSHDRIVAECDAGKTSAGPFAFGVGRAMIRSGFAVEYRIFTKGIYAVDEDRARMERRGIWKDWPQ